MDHIGLTTIANGALILLGSVSRISSIDEVGSLPAQARDIFTMLIPEILESHPWNFAVTRSELPRENPDEFAGRWPWRFQLPADCLRWLPWDRADPAHFDGVEESGFLLSDDEGPITIRYIRNEKDPTRWSAGFRALVVAEMAYHLAATVADSQSARDRMERKAEAAILKAKRADGLAGTIRKRPAPHELSHSIRAMHGNTSGDPTRWHR